MKRNKFTYRLSDRIITSQLTIHQQNYQFPAIDKLNYNSHIIGFMHNRDLQFQGMNVLLSDGQQTKLWINELRKVTYNFTKFAVKTAIIKTNTDTELTGIQLLD